MADPVTTSIDTGSLVLGSEQPEYRDELLTLAAADEIAEGTILARDSVSGKLVLYVDTGTPTNENNVPKAVLPYAVSASAAGDVAVRALVKGTVNKARLVIDAGTTIVAKHLDQLRDYGITAVAVQQLSK